MNPLTPDILPSATIMDAPSAMSTQPVALVGAVGKGRSQKGLQRAITTQPDGSMNIHVTNLVTTINGGTITVAMLSAALGNYIFGSVSFTIGAEAGDKIRVTGAILDVLGNAWNKYAHIEVWMSSTATGTADSTFDTITLITGTALETITGSGTMWRRIVTDATGTFAFDLTKAGAYTSYMRVAVGEVVAASAAVVWAA